MTDDVPQLAHDTWRDMDELRVETSNQTRVMPAQTGNTLLTGNTFEVGHMTNRTGGRERVYVVIRCVHGTEDAPQEYISEHSDYDRLDMALRGEVIDTAIGEHRQALREEHSVECDCRMPKGFIVSGRYLAEGYS